MNDFMSFGVHRLWKDYTIQDIGLVSPKRNFGQDSEPYIEKTRVLDVACGTGDMTLKFYQYQKNHSLNPKNMSNELDLGTLLLYIS